MPIEGTSNCVHKIVPLRQEKAGVFVISGHLWTSVQDRYRSVVHKELLSEKKRYGFLKYETF